MSKLPMMALCAASMFVLAGCSNDEGRPPSQAEEPGQAEETGEAETGETEAAAEDQGDDQPTSTSASFVPGDVHGGAASCDAWTQDCPEDEKCAAWSSMGDTWDANKCVPILGTGRTGDECSYDGAAQGTDTCDAGHMCYYTNSEGLGTCMPLCTGNPDTPMCPSDFNCSISNDGALVVCIYACDPLLQDCERDGSGCFWDGAKFNCDPAGELLETEPCGYVNDCSPGHICLDAMSLPACAGSSCCAGFCDLQDPNCGVEGTECIAFFDQGTAPPGLENTGVCTLPGS